VEISGLGPPSLRYIFGIDAFQALQLGLDYIAIRTSTAALRPFWFEPGDSCGFSRSIPDYLPPATQRKLQAVIDRAGARWAKEQKRAASRRRRRKSS
jgi:hypothetical protein